MTNVNDTPESHQNANTNQAQALLFSWMAGSTGDIAPGRILAREWKRRVMVPSLALGMGAAERRSRVDSAPTGAGRSGPLPPLGFDLSRSSVLIPRAEDPAKPVADYLAKCARV